MEVADYKGKKFIVIWVPGGYLRPYSSPKSVAKGEKERVYYIRKMASTIALSEESKHMEFVDLCRNMNIVNSLPEYTKPKNVGLMFFSLEPQRFFPYAQIDVVQFPDDLGGDKIIEKTFKDPLHQQLREALLNIRNNIITEQVIRHPDRAEADRQLNFYSFSPVRMTFSIGRRFLTGLNQIHFIKIFSSPKRIIKTISFYHSYKALPAKIAQAT